MQFTEPISRRLNYLGRVCLSVLSKRIKHLDINRYYYPLTIIHLHNGKLSQNALAQLLGKDKSAMVSIIDLLTETGYVKRTINPQDRREHLISTTKKAERDVPQIMAAYDEMNKDLTKGISIEEMTTFYSVLNKMKDNITPFSIPSSSKKPNDSE